MQKANDLRSTIKFALFFSVIGFFLNLVWEYFQCSPFFRHIQTRPNVESMVIATFGDIAIMWFIYMLVAIVCKSPVWFQARIDIKHIAALLVSSLMVAIAVELWALNQQRWSYTENNPTLPYLDVSVLPILQLIIVNPISVYGSKKLTNCLAYARQN